MGRGTWMAVAGLGVMVAGCGLHIPAADTVTPDPVPGVALPFKARVMVFAGQSDLDRKLVIQSSRYQTEETPVRDGEALAKAARTVLAKGFEQVTLNDPSIRPHLVVKLVGKAQWARLDAKAKIGCAFDVWTADGMPLGNFGARWDSSDGVDYTTEMEAAYGQCLKKSLNDFLTSPALAKLNGAGFKEPSAVAFAAFMKTLGPIPTGR